jgi:hypothetical protein
MYGQVHYNRVLYWGRPRQGAQFRQIVVVELEQFEVRIFDGEVLHREPNFSVSNSDAIYQTHLDMESALADATREFDVSVKSGWTPYVGP